MRLDGARRRSTPNGSPETFCWNSMPRSSVTRASYSPRMRCRRSPFLTPAQPRPTTVSTVCPLRTSARSTGSCSSRRTRTRQEGGAREIECGDRLLAPHGRELAKEFVEGLAAFEVVEERLDRNACADKDRRAAEDVGVAVYDLAELGHAERAVPYLGVYTHRASERITPACSRRPTAAADTEPQATSETGMAGSRTDERGRIKAPLSRPGRPPHPRQPRAGLGRRPAGTRPAPPRRSGAHGGRGGVKPRW